METSGDHSQAELEQAREWWSPPNACGYLPNETSSMHCRQALEMSASDYDALLARGWRRHGVNFFRPACPKCRQCRSLRVSLSDFRPSKSQRRCVRRHSDLQVKLTRPAVSDSHIELFNRYHEDMHDRRNWPRLETDAVEYADAFLVGQFDFSYELQFRRGDSLIGVSLIDMTSYASSSVYFYHEPDWRPKGPGVFSLLVELELATRRNLRHHYLGYWIAACNSMAYKAQYRPHELLQTFVDDDETPRWELACPE